MLFKRDRLEYEFLPAALEISETPPSPLGRFFIWMIFIIIAVALIWSYFGRVDEVAVARGKVIPDGKLKVIQPLEEGIITAIHVGEGQRIQEGQVLVELDTTFNKVDVESLEKELEAAKLEKEILKDSLNGGDTNDIQSGKSLPDERKNNQLKLSQAREAEYKSKREALTMVVSQAQAQLDTVQRDYEKMNKNIALLKDREQKFKAQYEAGGAEEKNLATLQKRVDILKKEAADLKELYEKHAASRKQWEDKCNEELLAEKEYEAQEVKASQEKNTLKLNWENVSDELLLSEEEINTQESRIAEANDKLEEAKKNLENLDKEWVKEKMGLIVDNDQKISQTEAELTKAQKKYELQKLTSPVTGTVLGVTVNTLGGVVTPAQPIMSVVPEGTPLIVESTVLNKDIGFVRVGQEVEVKFDTFPFQKYGIIKGRVIHVSPDAFEDEKLGPVYKMKISLEKTTIRVDGKEVNITPGMSVTSEIKTGNRRIIEFFLEPIIKYASDSLKLR